MPDTDRITELELELMAQRDLIDTLNAELTAANARADVMELRIERLERQFENLTAVIEAPTNDKPPHY